MVSGIEHTYYSDGGMLIRVAFRDYLVDYFYVSVKPPHGLRSRSAA